MDLTDFLTAQMAGARALVWVGHVDDRLESEVLTALVDVAETGAVQDPAAAHAAADADTVLVIAGVGSPEDVAGLADPLLAARPRGARSVVVADTIPADAEALAGALAAAGQRVVHVVRLHKSPGGSQGLAFSVEAVEDPGSSAARGGLTAANERRIRSSPLVEPVSMTPEESVAEMRAALVVERARRRAADRSAQQLQTDLDRARRDLKTLRSSATVQLGRALSAAASNPRRGVPALPAKVRTVLRDRSTRLSATAGAGPAPTVSSARQSLPVSGGRRRTFDLSLPDTSTIPASPHRRQDGPSTLHLDVPYPFFIPQRLERDGLAGYEPETLAWWLALCDAAPPGVVWDVGANTGLFASLAAAATTREVVAFEPTPDLANWGRSIAAANGLDYTVEQVAASDADGTATFFLSDSTDSSSSLAKGFRESTHQLDVITERLETFVHRTGRPPALIKVDTETTEPAVLRGASAVVAEHRPWILCEVLANCGVEEPLTELVNEWGYRWYHLTEDLPPPSPERIVGDPTYTYFMYLLAPQEIDEGLVERTRAWRAALTRCRPR